MDKFPIYKLIIDDSNESGVDFIALVDEPAIEKYFMAFSAEKEKKKFVADESRRILTGPLMIPDKLMYRNDDGTHGEHYVMFDKPTIEQIAVKFFRTQSGHNVNLMHAAEKQTEGVFLFESFLTDQSRGISAPEEFKDLPEGTWFGSFKVENPKIWDEYIKTGTFNGFSVEGFFEYEQADPALQMLAEFETELDKLLIEKQIK